MGYNSMAFGSLDEFLGFFGNAFEPIYDGKVHRFKPIDGKSKSGWFVGFQTDDITTLVASDWRMGSDQAFKWCSKKKMSAQEKIEYYESFRKALIERDKIRAESEKELALENADDLIRLKIHYDLSKFEYAKRKNIDDYYGSIFIQDKRNQFCLAIPMKDQSGKIWNYQKIYSNGDKLFQRGKAKGLFHTIGDINKQVILCEGFATGVSLFKATKIPVVVCFSAANLAEVAKNYIGFEVIVCGDDDRKNKTNAGKVSATKAKQITNGVVLFPSFDDPNSSCTDFNDVEIEYGLDCLRDQILGRIEPDDLVDFDIESNIKFDSGHYNLIESKDGSVRNIPDYDSMANSLHLHCTVLTASHGDMVYRSGFWQHMDATQLDNIVLRMSENQVKPNHYAGFVKQIRAKCFFGNIRMKETEGLLNVKNGIVDVKENKLIERKSEYFFKTISPVIYDPKAKCPVFESFLYSTFNFDSELVNLVQDMFGYTILGGYPFLHKAFVLHGTGRNGKSTLLDALKGILGNGTWSSVSMSMIDKPFSAVMLDGKLANIVTEISNSVISSEIFKSVVAGEPITAAYKGKDEYSMIPQCRMIFACNDLPRFADNTVGMQDRLVMIPFENYIKEENRDTKIGDKIKAEFSGILNWSIIGAQRVIKNGGLTKAGASETLKSDYIKDSDQVALWFSECVKIEGINAGEKLKKSTAEIYQIYRQWAEVNGNESVSKRTFEMRLSRLCKLNNPATKSKKLMFGNAQLMGYDDLSIQKVFYEKDAFGRSLGPSSIDT